MTTFIAGSGNNTPEEFLVGTGTGFDYNDDHSLHGSTLSAV